MNILLVLTFSKKVIVTEKKTANEIEIFISIHHTCGFFSFIPFVNKILDKISK